MSDSEHESFEKAGYPFEPRFLRAIPFRTTSDQANMLRQILDFVSDQLDMPDEFDGTTRIVIPIPKDEKLKSFLETSLKKLANALEQ